MTNRNQRRNQKLAIARERVKELERQVAGLRAQLLERDGLAAPAPRKCQWPGACQCFYANAEAVARGCSAPDGPVQIRDVLGPRLVFDDVNFGAIEVITR